MKTGKDFRTRGEYITYLIGQRNTARDAGNILTARRIARMICRIDSNNPGESKFI